MKAPLVIATAGISLVCVLVSVGSLFAHQESSTRETEIDGDLVACLASKNDLDADDMLDELELPDHDETFAADWNVRARRLLQQLDEEARAAKKRQTVA